MRTLLVAVVAAGAIWLVAAIALLAMGRRFGARRIAVFLGDVLGLVRGLMRDPDLPRAVRWALRGALIWTLSPIDLLPEFLPVVGPIDDIVVLVLALRFALRRAGSAALRAHWRGSAEGLRLVMRAAGVRNVDP